MAVAEWVDTITRIYREALAEAGPDGADRQEVLIVAGARIETEIRAGRLGYTLERFIESELKKVDEKDGKLADGIIRAAATGSIPLDDVNLDVVVTLGRGRRKLWRDVTADDLSVMHEVRRANYINVRDSFREWETYYRKVRPVLFEFGTFGAAVERGGFPPKPAAAAA